MSVSVCIHSSSQASSDLFVLLDFSCSIFANNAPSTVGCAAGQEHCSTQVEFPLEAQSGLTIQEASLQPQTASPCLETCSTL